MLSNLKWLVYSVMLTIFVIMAILGFYGYLHDSQSFPTDALYKLIYGAVGLFCFFGAAILIVQEILVAVLEEHEELIVDLLDD